jgi:hypothetical protein
MVNYELLRGEGILVIRPETSLEAGDFRESRRKSIPILKRTASCTG